MNEYKMVAPHMDELMSGLDMWMKNRIVPSDALKAAMEAVYEELKDLEAFPPYHEVKAIWLRIPRGDIADYDSYEELLKYGEVKNWKEFEESWLRDYPDPFKWYELIVSEVKHGNNVFRSIQIGDQLVIYSKMERDSLYDEELFDEERAIALCKILAMAARESMRMLREGTYHDLVVSFLPYSFRKGILKRADVWERDPKWKEKDQYGLSKETIAEFAAMIESGINDETKIGRMKSMTANIFFRACEIGYKALGYNTDFDPVDQYLRYGDRRDEGLTGRGIDSEGESIDPDDPEAWDNWFFHRKRQGGHPWEVIRGGSYYHICLFVFNDEYYLEEGEHRSPDAGYYFEVAGGMTHEAVIFYLALSKAGLPVVLSGAEDILHRLKGEGYIGVVPHTVHLSERCCELFPDEYDVGMDFMHAYKEEMEKYKDVIQWLPVEDEARILS